MGISTEERKEKGRQNVKYTELVDRNLYIEQKHWNKFDQILKPIHCYIYAVKSLGSVVPRYIVWVNTGSTLPLIRKTIAVRFLIVRNPLARILATLIKLLSPSSMPLLI